MTLKCQQEDRRDYFGKEYLPSLLFKHFLSLYLEIWAGIGKAWHPFVPGETLHATPSSKESLK
jgi:hypothetical protein